MTIRYRVDLTEAEHNELAALLNGGSHAVRTIKRAQILLAADAGASDETIASAALVGLSTVFRTRRRFVEGNLEAALSEEARPGVRWSPWFGQFGGLAKLGSGYGQAANVSVPIAQYASSGVRPASAECGRRAL